MGTIAKQGDKFVYDGLVLEAQESERSCKGCFFMIDAYNHCLGGETPDCTDLDNDKDVIFKYLREATDEEIRKGAVDV